MSAPRDAEHDAHLRAALRHAPDHDASAPELLSARILAQAHGAVVAAAPRGSVFERWFGLLARPSTAGALGSVLLAGVIAVMWREGVPPEALPGGDVGGPQEKAVATPRAPATTPAASAGVAAPAAPAAATAAADAPAAPAVRTAPTTPPAPHAPTPPPEQPRTAAAKSAPAPVTRNVPAPPGSADAAAARATASPWPQTAARQPEVAEEHRRAAERPSARDAERSETSPPPRRPIGAAERGDAPLASPSPPSPSPSPPSLRTAPLPPRATAPPAAAPAPPPAPPSISAAPTPEPFPAAAAPAPQAPPAAARTPLAGPPAAAAPSPPAAVPPAAAAPKVAPALRPGTTADAAAARHESASLERTPRQRGIAARADDDPLAAPIAALVRADAGDAQALAQRLRLEALRERLRDRWQRIALADAPPGGERIADAEGRMLGRLVVEPARVTWVAGSQAWQAAVPPADGRPTPR